MKQQIFLCVDVKFRGHANVIKEGESRNGMLTMVDQDRFRFDESRPKERGCCPDRRWHLLDRTKHGRISANKHHVKVEFYIHHEDYLDGQQLGNMLVSETETMREALLDMDIQQALLRCC